MAFKIWTYVFKDPKWLQGSLMLLTIIANSTIIANFTIIANSTREQILMESNWRLHREGPNPGHNSARAENPIPFWKTGLGFLARANGLKNLKKIPCNRNGISAWAEKQKKRWLLMRRRSDFSGIKAIKWRISLILKLRWNMRTLRQG